MSRLIFSQRVREARIAKGLSRQKASLLAGYDKRLLDRIEGCEGGRNSRLQTVFDLADALDVSPAWLIGADE